jgi:hypothetical protein
MLNSQARQKSNPIELSNAYLPALMAQDPTKRDQSHRQPIVLLASSPLVESNAAIRTKWRAVRLPIWRF